MSQLNIKADFPALNQEVRGQPLVYLDSAATTQKPQSVISAVQAYYAHDNANVHRAAHALAERATDAMEQARQKVAQFVGSPSVEQVIFTRGTTEGVNLVASGLGQDLRPGDEILVTELEHHSNFVPWQMAAERSGASFRVARATADGDIDLADFASLLTEHTKIVAFGHVSNALGSINPVEDLVRMVRERCDAIVFIDGAQAALHLPLDLPALDADFYAFSSHKMFGPTGVGVLWGKRERLEALPPYQFGGEMIERVSTAGSTFNQLPYKFEAGTPNIAGIVGLGAAVDYVSALPREEALQAENKLIEDAIAEMRSLNGIRLVGTPKHRLGVVSFVAEAAHPHDLGTLLDQQGIAVRTGHHCAMPLMSALELPGTVRASFSLYNDQDDVNRLIQALRKALTFL